MAVELQRTGERQLRIVKAKDVKADDTEYQERRALVALVKLLRKKHPDTWNDLVTENNN
jgi:hypothetical protein